MGVFSPENKVRLCAAIFTALIFLDIIAFFDTLSPMLGFCKRQSASSVPLGLRHNYKGQSYDIETTNSSSQNYTKSMEYEMKEEGEFHGEMVHDVAVLLVEVLGLAILLVANSYIYSNISAKLSFDRSQSCRLRTRLPCMGSERERRTCLSPGSLSTSLGLEGSYTNGIQMRDFVLKLFIFSVRTSGALSL